MSRDVFISYRQEDRAVAERLCGALEGRNISCWIAPRDIYPGQEWAYGIVEGLKRCHCFVVILSEHSKNARQIAREVELADSSGLRMITFRIEDVQPPPALLYFLGNVQWLDAFPNRFEQAFARLVDVIRQNDGFPAARTTTRAAFQPEPERQFADVPPPKDPQKDTPACKAARSVLWSVAAGVLLAATLGAGSYVKLEQARAHRAFDEGQRDFAAHRLADADASYSVAIALDRSFYLAYCRRAIVRHAMKKEVAALEDINKALELNRSWALGFRIRGDIKRSWKQYGSAIQDYDTAIATNTPDPRGISNIGLAFLGRARARRALGQVELASQDETAARALCAGSDSADADPALACG